MTELRVVGISGSPSPSSKTARVNRMVLAQMAGRGIAVTHHSVAAINPAALLCGDTRDQALASLLQDIEVAHGVVVATPVFKASMSGMLKCVLDIMPQFAFTGKVVLPLATGGSASHVLALDYGIRPVLQSMGSRHVVQSLFVSEADMVVDGGELSLNDRMATAMRCVVDNFAFSLSADEGCKHLGLLLPHNEQAA